MRSSWSLLVTFAALACAGTARPTAEAPVPAVTDAPEQGFPLAPGARVRVVRTRGRPRELIGTLAGRRTDSLVLFVGRGARRYVLAVADVQSLDVSRGTHRHVLGSAARGLVGAAGIGAFFSLLGSGVYCVFFTLGSHDCPVDRSDVREIVATGAGTFGVLGLGFGALYGYVDRGDVWERVPLERIRN